MGHLLSSAIKMQGAAAAPTLVITFNDFAGGAGCDVYKNGVFFATALGNGTPLTVPIVAGNTFFLQISAPVAGFNVADYFINGVSQGTQTTTTTLATTTRTASGTNAYSYTVIADIF